MNGPNVYPGVPHDYTKEVCITHQLCHIPWTAYVDWSLFDVLMEESSQGRFLHNIHCIMHLFTQEVTPENFLNVLQGNAEAMSGVGSGKVLSRWENQYIIVNV